MSHEAGPSPLRPLKPASADQGPATAQLVQPPDPRVSIACLNCKRKKTKCSGQPAEGGSCRACLANNVACVFDESLDQRRKVAGKRRDELFEKQTRMVDDLFELVRTGDDNDVQRLLDLIRADIPIAEIAAAVKGFNDDQKARKRKRSRSPSEFSPATLRTPAQHSVRNWTSSEATSSAEHTGDPSIDRRTWHPSLQIPTGQAAYPAHDSIWPPEAQICLPPNIRTRVSIADLDKPMPMQQESSEETVFAPQPPTPTDQMEVDGDASSEDLTSTESRTSSPRRRRRRQSPLQPRRQPYPTPGYVEVFGNLPMSSAISANHYPRYVQTQQLSYFRLPVHLIQSLVIIENSPLARVYTDYRDAARQMLAEGTPSIEVTGPNFTEVDLFFRDREPRDFYTASTWASELSKAFGSDGVSIYVQLAGLYLLTNLMKWTIAPSQQTYADMPSMIRPTSSQRLIPHPGPVDLCALPPTRDALITKMRDFIKAMINANVSINWPYPLSDCTELDPATGKRKLTAAFERHVAIFENWTVDSSFLSVFPELAGKVGIKHGAFVRSPTHSRKGSTASYKLSIESEFVTDVDGV